MTPPRYCPVCGQQACMCDSGDGWRDVVNGDPEFFCVDHGDSLPCDECRFQALKAREGDSR
jgi:hypothetical protein